VKKKKIYIIVVLFLALSFGTYSFLPEFLVQHHNTSALKNLNLEIKKINYDNDFFEYVEGGNTNRECIVLVHGFQSSKNFWVPYIREFSKNYSIIALDLPGHGNSSRPKNQKYDLQSITDAFSKFIELKKIEKFHLIGTSLGGGIATVYTYNHPEKVKSLILINPLGIDHVKKSELQNLLAEGKNLFFPNNLKEFDEMAFYISGKSLNLSIFIKNHILNQMISKYSFFKDAFNQLLTKTKPVDNLLPKISTPTLILIGKKDRIILPETYEDFVKFMPNIKPIRLENGNHVLVDENLDIALKEINLFLNSN
jgi:pimeloyl-ACP methyl ester carboxylesterase